MTVPGVYSPEQIAAHVDKVIASDGVGDEEKVEAIGKAAWLALARGYPAIDPPSDWWDEDDWEEWRQPEVDWDKDRIGIHIGKSGFLMCARAALGALRALEGDA